MGLTSALGIGRTALAAYQAALQITGQNIANIATPGYTRTSAQLSAVAGPRLAVGQLGQGVRITSVRRSISETLEARLRNAISDKTSAGAERDTLSRVEGLFDPLGNTNLGSLMSEFFGALNDLQNNPDNIASRGIVISAATTLAERIRSTRSSLIQLRNELNTEIQSVVQQGDELATKIAAINKQVALAEAGQNGPAASLRDERDQLLSELSGLFDITTREQPNGAVNVYIGNESLVQLGTSFGLKTVTELNADGLASAVVRFKINNGPVTASSGQVEGLINSRDVHSQAQFAQLDALASALIHEVNKIHSGGQGLQGFSTITGLSLVTDPTQPLTALDNGIDFIPRTGSFFIDVKDTNSGSVVRTQINIDLDGIGTDTTLDSLAADINANVAGVTATVLPNGQLQLTAAAGSTFTFSNDTSGTLAALNINTFFTGRDSRDINVNSLIAGNPALLAAAQSDFTGDGSNATALSSLQDTAVASLNGVSLNEFYNAAMADLAVRSSAANSAVDAADIIADSLTVQRESISGVNLDEEAISLVSFQRAFEGVARYMNVVDEMLQTLLTLVR